MLTPVKFGKIFQLAAPVKIGKNFQLAGAGVACVRTGPTGRMSQLVAPPGAQLAAHIVVAPIWKDNTGPAHPGRPVRKRPPYGRAKGGKIINNLFTQKT